METESVAKATHEFGDTEECFGLQCMYMLHLNIYITINKDSMF